MSTQTFGNDNHLTINTPEKFDFQWHSEFKTQYEVENRSRTVVLDMYKTVYMDSSALGMMLQLKEHAEKNNWRIKIKNVNQNIQEIMKIAHFDKMFNLN